MSGDGHDYEGKYGTQEAQAAKQASVGQAEANGPWRLVRIAHGDGRGDHVVHYMVVLPNSARSTMTEATRLVEDEKARTGIEWQITPYDRDDHRAGGLVELDGSGR